METAVCTLTDDDLKEYLFLQACIKQWTVRLEEIRRACKEAGSFCTENHVCAVYIQEQTRMASLETTVSALGKELLEDNGLINHLSFQVVKIAERIKV